MSHYFRCLLIIPGLLSLESAPASQAGSILISEDFTSSASNFRSAGADARVSGGKYLVSGKSLHQTILKDNWALTVAAGPGAQGSNFCLLFGFQDEANYYYVNFDKRNDETSSGIFKVEKGNQRQLAKIAAPISGGEIYVSGVTRLSNTYEVFLNGVLVASARDSSWPAGRIGLGTSDNAQFDSLLVTKLNPIPFPTHPNQTGLSALGIERNKLPVQPDRRFDANDSGTVISDVSFDGPVYLNGTDGITFRRCWFKGNGADCCIKNGSNTPLNTTIEDCDFGNRGESNWMSSAHLNGLGGVNHIRRCFFYNSCDSIKWANGSVNYLEDCWVQPIYRSGAHMDCMQLNDGVQARFFATRCTFEKRSWIFDGVTSFDQEELSKSTITTENIAHWGNGTAQTGPCPGSICPEPLPNCYFSFVSCLVTGGNYIMTGSNQNGQFLNNIVLRGTGNPGTDLGLRNSQYLTIAGNRFHDDGAVYPGRGVGGGTNPTPVSRLKLLEAELAGR